MVVLYPIEFSTEKSTEINNFLTTARNPVGNFRFKVRAREDVHVMVTSSTDAHDPSYEFVIGKGNRLIMYKNSVTPKEVASTKIEDLLSEGRLVSFRIHWNGETIAIGEEGASPFFEYPSKRDGLPPIKFVGVRTGSSRGDWEIARPEIEFSSKSGAYAENFLPMSFSRSLRFRVKANTDACITLSRVGDFKFIKPTHYKICFGNGRITIHKDEIEMLWKEIKEKITEKDYRGFWINWDNNRNEINIGPEESNVTYVHWKDVPRIVINFASFNITQGGSWKVEQSDIELKIETSRKYDNFIPTPSGRINFRVCSSDHARIALTAKPEDAEPMYQIILGNHNNQTCTISSSLTKKKHSAHTPSILDKYEFLGFSVIWGDGRLRLEREGSSEPLLSIDDTARLPINYAGFRNDKDTVDRYIIEQPLHFVPHAPPPPNWGSGNWVSCKNGEVPHSSFPVDPDDDSTYVIRAYFQGGLIPGNLAKGSKSAYVTWGGLPHPRVSYEVLSDFDGGWKDWYGSEIPENALVSGRSAEGEDLYVGRVKHEGIYTVGKVQFSEGVCYISRDGKEISFDQYHILGKFD